MVRFHFCDLKRQPTMYFHFSDMKLSDGVFHFVTEGLLNEG